MRRNEWCCVVVLHITLFIPPFLYMPSDCMVVDNSRYCMPSALIEVEVFIDLTVFMYMSPFSWAIILGPSGFSGSLFQDLRFAFTSLHPPVPTWPPTKPTPGQRYRIFFFSRKRLCPLTHSKLWRVVFFFSENQKKKKYSLIFFFPWKSLPPLTQLFWRWSYKK